MRYVVAVFCMVILVTALPKAGSADIPDDLKKWIVADAPTPNWEASILANNDVKHGWIVTLQDGQPRVGLPQLPVKAVDPLPFKIGPGTAREGLAGRRFVQKVDDGWIVAFNAGEFGAGLWWFSEDGKRRERISEAWVKSFIPTKTGLLAVEGIAHMFESRGRISRLARDPGGHWRSEEVVDLKHAPEVALKLADDSLLVATTNRLLRVIPAEKRVEVRLKDVFWGSLYPNSMIVTPDGTTYLGMRHGVAKVEKTGPSYRAVWLLPNQEFAEQKLQEGFR